MDSIKVKLGLKAKLALFNIFIILILLGAFSFTTYVREKDSIISNIKEKAVLISSSLSQQVYDPITRSNITLIKDYVDETKESNKDILNIWVVDEDDNCIGSNDTSSEGKTLTICGLNCFRSKTIKEAEMLIKNHCDVSEPRFKGKKEVETLSFFKLKSLFVANRVMLKNEKKDVIDSRGVVIVEMSLSSLKEQIGKMIYDNVLLFVVFTIIAIILSNIMGKIITGPLAKIMKGTEKVALGDFDIQISVNSTDELGLLAQRFNYMTENVTILYDVAQATNFINDSEELLKVILDKVRVAVKANRGSLMLLNDENDLLELKVVRGDFMEVDVENTTALKIGEGIAGKVIETGKSVIINKGYKDPMFKSFSEDREKSIDNMMVVPLKVDDKPIGVINVINKNGVEFQYRDQKLVEAMASTASMAIQNAKLYELAITDGMTKLFIHRYFQARLEDEVVRARRYGNHFSLVMFDIDHFKNFNDTYGHQQGDVVIIQTAKIIKDTIRHGIDIASRYGGEEFTVILPETDVQGAWLFAERLRIAIEEYEYPWKEGQTLNVTISLGIATFPVHAKERMKLIKISDDALYVSKEKGRNTTTTADELPQFNDKES